MSSKERIQIIPLGGLGEIGKNMMILEHGDTGIIIDAGMMFPGYQMHGIDFVIPDFSYIIENRSRIQALILTHGHEDHIGALPYLIREINVPIYGTKLTLGFARNRLAEHSFPYEPHLIEIFPRQSVKFGQITAEFFRVCHSVADGVGIAFHTPLGTIIHSGDFKVDFTPVHNDYLDLQKLAELGEKGILLLMADSTNSENAGYTPSERELSHSLLETITSSEGKVLVATFASNIYRIQQIFDICNKVKKKVAIVGMSMERNISMAKDLGYLEFEQSLLIPPEKVKSYGRKKIVILTTGSQGEPMSALSRIANNRYKSFEVERGDTVILSSSIIPGNEQTVSKIVNSFFKKGASVYYEGFEDLHVSGHASREELKLLLSVTKPKYFIPIHGEMRHLIHHSNLAKQMGIREENIIIAGDGDVIRIDEKGVAISNCVAAGNVYIDGKNVGEIEHTILKDRQRLSRDGIVIVVVTITNEKEGVGLLDPEITSKGFVYSDESEDLFNNAKMRVLNMVKQYLKEMNADLDHLKDLIKAELGSYFKRETGINPIVLPIIIEV